MIGGKKKKDEETSSFEPSNSTENTKLRQQIQELTDRINLMKSQHSNEVNGLKTEYQMLQKVSKQAETDKNNQIQRLEDDNKTLLKDIKELTRSKQQIAAEINSCMSFISTKLNQSIKSVSEISDAFTELIKQNESFTDEIDHLKQSSSMSQEEITNQYQIEIKKYKKIIRSMRKQLEGSKQEPRKIDTTELDRKNQKIQNLNELVLSYKHQVKNLNQKINEMQVLNENKIENESKDESFDETQNDALHAQITMLNHHINELELENLNYQKTCEDLKSINSEYQLQIGSLTKIINDHSKENSEMAKKVDKYKKFSKQYKELFDLYQQQKQQLDQALENNRMLEIESNLNKSKMSQLQQTVNSQDIIQRSAKQKSLEIEAYSNSLTLFESLISSQSEEMTSLQNHNNYLTQSLISYEQKLQYIENYVAALLKKLKQTENDMKHNVEAFEERENKERTKLIISFKRIITKLPTSIQEQASELSDKPPCELIESIVTLLLSNERNNQTEEIFHDDEPEHNYQALLQHLDNSNRFLKKLTSNMTDCSLRQEISKEISIVEQEIDKYSFDVVRVPSLFVTNELSRQEQVKTLFADFVSDEQLKESPIRELAILFSTLGQVNFLLESNYDSLNIQSSKQRNQIEELTQKIVFLEEELSNKMNENKEESVSIEEEQKEEEKPEIVDNEIERTEEIIHEDKNDEIEKLQEKIDKLKDKIHSMKKKMEEDQAKYTKNEQMNEQASKMIDELQERVIKESKENKNKIDELSTKLTQKEGEISKLNYNLEEKLGIISELKQENEILTDEIESLKTRIKEFHSSIDEDQKTIAKLIKKLDRESKHKLQYKAKTISINQELQQNLNEKAKIEANYKSTIIKLEEDLRTANESITSAQKEVSDFAELRQNLIVQNSKLIISEQTLKVQLKALQEKLNSLETTYALKQDHVRLVLTTQLNAQINYLEQQVEQYKSLLIMLVQQEYDPNVNSSTSLDEMEKIIRENSIKKHPVIADALRLRQLLELDSNSTLCQVFEDKASEIETLILKYQQIERENNDIQKELVKSKREILNQESKILDLREWNSWGKSLARQITNGLKSLNSNSEIRNAISESVYSSISTNSLIQKLEILRSEKRMLISPRAPLLTPPTKNNNTVKSIRPLLLVAVFAHRMRVISGSTPMKLT